MLRLRRASAADLSAVFRGWEALYAGDPAWIPPPFAWQRSGLSAALADPQRFVLFLAERGGAVVGTASVQRDRDFDADPRVLWLGFFEAADADVAHALLVEAVALAQAWGAGALRGPRGLSRFEQVGLTVEGFDAPPPMLQGHHKPDYAGWLAQAGFEAHHDHYAYETTLVEPDGRPRALPQPLADKAAACAVEGLTFRRARRRRLDADLVLAHRVLNEAYATVPDIRPMPRAQFLGLTRAVLLLGHPELIRLGFVGDRPVAFAVCLPEINEALAEARGRLWPGGWATVLRSLSRIETAAFKLIGVAPDLRGTGAHAALIADVVRGAQAGGFTRMDGSIIDARNAPMRGVVEGVGMRIYRTYRVFQKAQ